jgi:TIR domain
MSLVFIFHSSRDKATATQLLTRLREQGYDSLFLDTGPDAGLKAGGEWERDLYRNLKVAGAVVVLCSPESMASRWCFAEIMQAKALGKPLFPVIIRPCELVGPLLDRQAVDMTEPGKGGFRRLFDGLRAAGLDPADSFDWDPRRPPYPGLLHFDQEDAGIYFGRNAEVRRVIELLTRSNLPGEPRLAVVIGASGSGASRH